MVLENHTINCPYCNSINVLQIEVNKPTKINYVHPPDFNIDEITSFDIFKNSCPEGIIEKEITCINCKEEFHTELFPYTLEELKCDSQCYKYLKILSDGPSEKITQKPLFVDLLDKYFIKFDDFLGTYWDNPFNFLTDVLASLILVTLLSPIMIFGFLLGVLAVYEELIKLNTITWFMFIITLIFYSYFLYSDKRFAIGIPVALFVSFCYFFPNLTIYTILLTIFIALTILLFKRHLKIISNIIDPDKLPIALHKEYKNRKDYNLFIYTQLSIHPYNLRQKIFRKNIQISNATLTGIVFTGFALLAFIIYYINWLSSPYNLFVTIIGSIIFFVYFSIFLFSIGNIFWVSVVGTPRIFYYLIRFPLKINLLKNHGGLEIFGTLFISSIILIISTSLIFISIPIWEYIQSFMQVSNNSNLKDMISDLLKQQPSAIFQYIFPILYLGMIVYAYFYPILLIRNTIKQKKEEKLDNILNEIELNENSNDYARNTFLLSEYEKILKISEWPFQTTKLDLAISFIVIVIIPLIIALIPTFI